eukprot:COSAG01_NODE_55918_length_321_cov_33.387387_1_plen_36_part_10
MGAGCDTNWTRGLPDTVVPVFLDGALGPQALPMQSF